MSNSTPQIRFKGYTGAWERCKLGELAPLQRGFDLPKNEMIDGIYPVVMSNGINGYHSEYKAKAPGVVTGRSGTIGNLHYIDTDYWPHNTSLWVTDFKGNNPKFIYHLYSKVDLSRFGTGSGVPTLNRNDVHGETVFIPIADEQRKISDLLSSLDTTITLYRRKLDGLRELKRGYLQQMFPQAGACVPRVRFAGFDEPWVLRELKSMTTYKNGKGHEDKQSDSGVYELINLNSISIDGGLKPSGKFISETNETLLVNDLVMVLSDVGHGNLLGRVALIPTNNKYVLNQRVALLRPNETANPAFLFSYINANQQYFKQQGAGMSQLNISKGSVEDFQSYVPIDIKEQIVIGNFFRNLDGQVTTQAEKLELLKRLKAAYLQSMFV